MEKLLRDALMTLLTTGLAGFGGCLAGGCSQTNKHSVGFEQTTRWAFFAEAKKTDATAKTTFPAVVELILGKPEPEIVEPE